MGSNYVLGTRDEDNEFEPRLVHPKQFLENRVDQIGLGVQHVVVLTTASQELDSCLPSIKVGASVGQTVAKSTAAGREVKTAAVVEEAKE